MKVSCVLCGVGLHEEPLTQYIIQNSEHFTLLVCLLQFLVVSAIRQLGNVQSFKTWMFRF